MTNVMERLSARRGMDVLLAVDVGNTNVKLGIFHGDVLRAHWRIATDVQRTADELSIVLGRLLEQKGSALADVRGVSLSSTVPAMVPILRELAERYLPPEAPLVCVTAQEAAALLTIAVDDPREMGADRIVDALAAVRLYRTPAIVIDFGTATTFDAVDAGGRLLGTAIAPGFLTAMEGLFSRAARLSRVEIERPATAIGRNTTAALRSGWIFGYVGLVEGLVQRIKAELGGEALVIATGGLAEDVVAETNIVDVHDPLLTLKGLRIYFEETRQQGSSGRSPLGDLRRQAGDAP